MWLLTQLNLLIHLTGDIEIQFASIKKFSLFILSLIIHAISMVKCSMLVDLNFYYPSSNEQLTYHIWKGFISSLMKDWLAYHNTSDLHRLNKRDLSSISMWHLLRDIDESHLQHNFFWFRLLIVVSNCGRRKKQAYKLVLIMKTIREERRRVKGSEWVPYWKMSGKSLQEK